jgi:hypothetical protein
MTSPLIYLAYAQQDRGYVDEVYSRLRDAGYRPWSYDEEVRPGEDWAQRIEESIKSADVFLPLISEHWMGEGYFHREVDIALDVKKSRGDQEMFIIPVMIRQSEFPRPLKSFQGIHLYRNNGWDTLFRSLGTISNAEELAPPQPPEGLITAFGDADAKPFVYVGAGMSVPMGLPSWRALGERLLEWAELRRMISPLLLKSLRLSLDGGDVDLVADTTIDLARASGLESELIAFLKEIFTGAGIGPGKNHKRLYSLAPGAVLTTNIDNILEQTFENKPVYTHLDTEPLLNALSTRQFFVLKLYGDLERLESVMVSPRQYEDSIVGNLAFSQFMENVFVSRTLFFLGSSLDGIEAYLRGIKFRGTLSRQHYALVAVTDATWRAKAESLRRRYQIEVIPYAPSSDYAEVDHFLDAIANRVTRSTAGNQRVATKGRGRTDPGIAKVRLENVGPFVDVSLELDRNWNILLGNNGVGKSNILRALAAAHCGRDANTLADRLIKYQKPRGRIILETRDGKEYVTQMDRSSSVPQIDSLPGRIMDLEGWLALGFPALRTVTWRRTRGPQVEERRSRPNSEDLLPIVAGGPDPRMDDLKQWIVNIDYRTKDKSVKGRERYGRLLEEFFDVIGKLTDGLKVKFDKVDIALGQVIVVTDDGPVPLESVSQGTISLFGWIGVLMQRMYEVYVGDDNPIARYALVLIDEIDAHMHPYWQLKLIPLLRKCFPNVQFVATTHSPLVLCNVGDGAVFLCERDESDNLLQVRRKKGSLNGLGADGLLTSSYFGLRTQLDDATQKLLDQKVEYAARDKGVRLTAKERAELEKINRKLDEVGLLTTFADPYYTAFLQGLARKRKLSEFQKQTFSNKALQEREQLIDEIFKELEEEETNAVR